MGFQALQEVGGAAKIVLADVVWADGSLEVEEVAACEGCRQAAIALVRP